MHHSSSIKITNFVFFAFSYASVAFMFLLGGEIGPGSISSTIFLFWFSVALFFLLGRVKYTAQLFSPSFLAFTYIGLSFVGGSAIPQDYHVWVYQDALGQIEKFNFLNGYLLICLWAIAVVSAHTLQRSKSTLENLGSAMVPPNKLLISISFTALFISAFIDYYLMFGVRFGLAVIISLNLAKTRSSLLKFIGYMALIVIFLLSSFQNKREIILIIFLILFTLSTASLKRFNYSPKNLIVGASTVGVAFVAILAASISRGYGAFDTNSPIESVLLVGRYISSPFFFRSFLENIEIVHTYASSVVAVDYIAKGDISLQAGATFIKPLFLPIPREVFPLKPESALIIFTTTLNPAFAATGNSLPVTIPAEVFMNFHFFGPIFLVFVFLMLERVFRVALGAQPRRLTFRGYFAIVFAALPLLMVRGGGFDLYTLTALLAAPSYFLVVVLSTKRNERMQFRETFFREDGRSGVQ